MKQSNIETISIAKDFSIYPGARYKSDGKYSGQEFYENIFKPKLSKIWSDPKKSLLLDFDGTFGYASSFISEIFIRAVKDFKDKELLKKKLKFKSDDEPLLIQSIYGIIAEANPSEN